ncbi:MAG TPA: hypothetical protein VGZ22_10750, partial [Isosphaeraceae bacterium]|nr:hypothetical protein [Isosphaeraceae bacterium]
MPTSDQQKLANQQNALKSTGPKTKAGKDRSRRNSLKHGLAGMGSVLPAEDMELFQERRLAWAGEEEPKGQVENYLVAVAALASVKLDRCARNEFAAIAKKRREALRNWQRRQDRRIKRAARPLETDPRAARAELEEFASGCGWLVEQWEELVQALDESGHWTEEQIARAGRLVNDDAAETLRAHALVLRPDQGIEPSARDAAMAGVRSIAAAEIERLSNERADIWYEAEGPDLAEAIDLATIDLSPDGALRHRYSVSANSDLHRSFARLAKRQEA